MMLMTARRTGANTSNRTSTGSIMFNDEDEVDVESYLVNASCQLISNWATAIRYHSLNACKNLGTANIVQTTENYNYIKIESWNC
jgi:hypothetical protein